MTDPPLTDPPQGCSNTRDIRYLENAAGGAEGGGPCGETAPGYLGSSGELRSFLGHATISGATLYTSTTLIVGMLSAGTS